MLRPTTGVQILCKTYLCVPECLIPIIGKTVPKKRVIPFHLSTLNTSHFKKEKRSIYWGKWTKDENKVLWRTGKSCILYLFSYPFPKAGYAYGHCICFFMELDNARNEWDIRDLSWTIA